MDVEVLRVAALNALVRDGPGVTLHLLVPAHLALDPAEVRHVPLVVAAEPPTISAVLDQGPECVLSRTLAFLEKTTRIVSGSLSKFGLIHNWFEDGHGENLIIYSVWIMSML